MTLEQYKNLITIHNVYNKHKFNKGICATCFCLQKLHKINLEKYLQLIPKKMRKVVVEYLIEKNPEFSEEIKSLYEKIKKEEKINTRIIKKGGNYEQK